MSPFDFGAWGRAAGAQLSAAFDRLLCAIQDGAQHGRDTAAAAEGMARTQAYQFGVPPKTGEYPPRSMLALPWAVDYDLDDLDEQVKGENGRLHLDLVVLRNRPVEAGYLSNVGDVPLRVAWVALDRSNSGFFSVPVNASLQVPCILRGILAEPAPGESGGVLQVQFL